MNQEGIPVLERQKRMAISVLAMDQPAPFEVAAQRHAEYVTGAKLKWLMKKTGDNVNALLEKLETGALEVDTRREASHAIEKMIEQWYDSDHNFIGEWVESRLLCVDEREENGKMTSTYKMVIKYGPTEEEE